MTYNIYLHDIQHHILVIQLVVLNFKITNGWRGQLKKYVIWKKSDIESLTTAYISGLRIKTIAHILGRSPCSINRALDRLKIRRPKILPLFTSNLDRPSRLKPKRPYNREPQKIAFTEIEVTLEAVLRWARDYYQTSIDQDQNQDTIVIHGIPKSPGQLVLECNRWRLAQNLPLYYVHGVCC